MAVTTNPKYTGTTQSSLTSFLGAAIPNPRNYIWQFEDMLNARVLSAGDTGVYQANSGNNTADVTSFKNHPGIRLLTTQTSVDSIAGDYGNNQWYMNKTLGAYFIAIVNIDQLSDATDEWILRAGFAGDILKGDIVTPTHGIYFKYQRTTSTNWLRCTANGGSETATSTGVVVTAAAESATSYVTLEFVLNPGGTTVDFYINGTYVGTNTTNILDETDLVYPQVIMCRTAGTAAKTVRLDAMGWLVGVER